MTPHVPLDEADTERGKGDGTENVDLIIPLSSLSPSLVGNDHHQHQQHHHVIGIDAPVLPFSSSPASSSNNSRMYEDIDNNNNNMMMMMGVKQEGEEMQSLRSSPPPPPPREYGGGAGGATTATATTTTINDSGIMKHSMSSSCTTTTHSFSNSSSDSTSDTSSSSRTTEDVSSHPNSTASDNENKNENQNAMMINMDVLTATGTTDGKEVDDLLSKELMKMDVYDRNSITEEIHGVKCLAPIETPEFVHYKLVELQTEIDATYDKPNYDKAQDLALARSRERTTSSTSTTNSSTEQQNHHPNHMQHHQQQQHPNNIGKNNGQDQQYHHLPKCYVNTNEFRMKFLRCELFDTKQACIRMLKYLDLMVELYGLFALERPIRLSDFTKKEVQILRAGYYQLWPFRDRSGRRIISIVGNLGTEYEPTIRLKAYFYFWMIASNDVESQQKGVVFLVWPSSNFKRDEDTGSSCDDNISNIPTADGTTASSPTKSASTFQQRKIPSQLDRELHDKCNAAAPIRLAAVHFCFPNNPFFHLLRSVMTMTLGIHYRRRLKFHVGEGTELQYILKSYGIPIENLPITDTGNIKTTYLKQWLRIRKIIEVKMLSTGRSTKNTSIIECPRSVDVVFRPGTSMLCNPGNVTFRGMIEANQYRNTVKRTDKEKVAFEIIDTIKGLGGRFLLHEPLGYWTDISDDPSVVDKITISYRDHKTKIRNAMLLHRTAANATRDTYTSNRNAIDPKTDKGTRKNKNTIVTAATTTLDSSTSIFLGQQDHHHQQRRKRTKVTNATTVKSKSAAASTDTPPLSRGCFYFDV